MHKAQHLPPIVHETLVFSSKVNRLPSLWREISSSKNWYALIFYGSFALLFAGIWGPRLVRSFWVDEAGTFWMAHEGAAAALSKAAAWPGQSVLYAVIASFFCLESGPFREMLLRLPTLAGIAAAGYFLYRLAEDVIGQKAGFIALIVFSFHPIIVSLGTQARPYGLALGAVTGSFWMLYRWAQTRAQPYLIGYVIASTLLVYFHFLFASVFFAQAIFLGYLFFVEHRTAHWKSFAAAVGLIAVLILPLTPQIRLLLREAYTLPFTPIPSASDVADFLISSLVALGVLVSGIITQRLFPNYLRRPLPLAWPILLMLIAWWLVGPALFFVASEYTAMRVFVPRYLCWSIPALSLLIAHIGYSVFGSIAGRFWALLAVVVSTASPMSMVVGHGVGPEELRPLISIIETDPSVPPAPFFFSSPLPESNFYDWRKGLQGGSYLYAPFVAYPVKNRLLPLPYRLTDEVKEHIRVTVRSHLEGVPKVLFFAHDPTWTPFMVAMMKDYGFDASVQRPNQYTAITFRRTPPRLEPAVR